MIELIIIAIMIAIDQVVKYLTVTKLPTGTRHVVIENVFEFVFVKNDGAAFGILENQQWLFKTFTSIFIVLAIYVLLKKLPKTKYFLPLRVVVVMFIAGGIGNLIDRFRLNYVIDTFYFVPIDFPVFNVADSYVVVGAFIFAFLILFKYKDEDFEFIENMIPFGKKKKKESEDESN